MQKIDSLPDCNHSEKATRHAGFRPGDAQTLETWFFEEAPLTKSV